MCYFKVLALDADTKGHAIDKELAVVKEYSDFLFGNVNSITSEGIKHAVALGFADAHLVDLIVTPFLRAISTLFKPDLIERVFSILLSK